MRFFNIVLLLVAFFVPNQGQASRPTEQAEAVDFASCLPMYLEIAACIATFPAGCAPAILAHGAQRNIQEGLADGFMDNSQIANHQDLNNDGLNDFSLEKSQSCFALVGETIPVTIYDVEGNRHSITKNGNYVGDGDASDYAYLIKSYTEEMVTSLPGCIRNFDGGIEGQTYELYDPNKYCEGVRVKFTDEEVCIKLCEDEDCRDDWCDVDDKDSDECKNSPCRWISPSRQISYTDEDGETHFVGNQLVCVEQYEDLMCAEAVFCSAGIGGLSDVDGADGWEEVEEGLRNFFDFNDINAKVDNGLDRYSLDANGNRVNNAVVDCSSFCKKNGDYKNLEMAEEIKPGIEGDNCFRDFESCSVCYDDSVCVDSEGKPKKDCDPATHPNSQQVVCGYAYNSRYLAHCVPMPYTSYMGDYDVPNFISPHCKGEAEVKSADGSKPWVSFAGRAMRCVDQSITNIFNGTYIEVGDKNNVSNQVKKFRCSTDDRQVDSPSECEAGLFNKMQNLMANTVTVALVLAIALIGAMVLIGGVFKDFRQIIRYIVVFSIILYFVRSDGWKDGYQDFIMEGGTELAVLIFDSFDFSVLDFGSSEAYVSVQLPNSVSCSPRDDNGPANIIYGENEKKYMVWDMLDCRKKNLFGNHYDGFGMNLWKAFTLNGFAILIVLTFGILIAPILFLLFIFVVLKSLFIMASTVIILSLLIFISPLIIPMVIFTNKKVRGVFDNWLKQLVGYSLVPVILFLTLGIFFKVIDHALYGSSLITDTGYGDVLTIDGEIASNCKDIYLPCILDKLNRGVYKTADEFTWFKAALGGSLGDEGFLRNFTLALLRFLFVLFIMVLVFNFITKSLIQNLLGITVMEDGIVSAAKKAMSFAAKAAKSAGKRAKGASKKASGKDGDYGLD